jgi:predicted phage baseplate assembly protein
MAGTGLSTCGCCDSGSQEAVARTNPPGLPEIRYRAGTHGSFTTAMRAAVSRAPALRSLTTRDLDDPSMAIIDGAAALLDVLTFHTERIANEGYLRTATERYSLLAMAAAIGYRPSPGVAASTYLAFTMDAVPGAPESVVVVPGTRAQSVPGQDEQPHTFETVEEIEARPEWNELRPATTAAQHIVTGTSRLYLAGTATGLRVGDPILLVGDERRADPASERWDVRRVAAIATVPDADPAKPGGTVVDVETPLGSVTPASAPPGTGVEAFALRERAALFGHNAMRWSDLPLPLRVGEINPKDNETFIEGPYKTREKSWADARFAAGTSQLELDRVVPGVVRNSWLVLTAPGRATGQDAELYGVTGVTEESVADFLLTAKVSRVSISGENIQYFSRRTATALCASESLTLAEAPRTDDVADQVIELAQPVDLPPGRTIVVAGSRAADGQPSGEVATVESVSSATIRLLAPLKDRYLRSTVVIHANVAAATHGESRSETLGSGDARQVFQTFALRQKPLTYTAAATGGGASSTLAISVDGIRWTEVDSLYGQPPTARVYVTSRADDGTVSAGFGDGITGSRLPAGVNNVVATFRVGIGLAATLDAGRITLLLSRPLGLSGVVNPVPAAGAADPETRDDARRNAPTTVLTLDRVVSLDDYAAFTRAFAGVGKAAAVPLWHMLSGEQAAEASQRGHSHERVIHLTVATALGVPIQPADPLHGTLVAAIDAARHPAHRVVVEGYIDKRFRVAAGVVVSSDRDSAAVLASAGEAIAAAYSFGARDFGQDVTAAEVLATIQAVDGVAGARLTALYVSGSAVVHDRLEARPARMEAGVFMLGELLTVAADGITLTEWTP